VHAPTSCTHVVLHAAWYILWWSFVRANFWIFIVKNCWGTPILSCVCVIKLWSWSIACNNLRGQHPQGPKCGFLNKLILGGSKCFGHVWNFFLLVDQSSPFFVERDRGCSWWLGFQIFYIRIRSGDIRDQSPKLSEIVLNFDVFVQNVSGGGPHNISYPSSHLPCGTSRGRVLWGCSHWPQSYWP